MRYHSVVTCLLFTAILIFPQCRKNDSNLFHRIDPVDFLSGEKYGKLLVEIQYMGGQEPAAATLDNLKAFLTARLNKPGGITFVQTVIGAQGKYYYSLEDIKNIEDKNRTYYTKRGQLTAYVLLVDGEFSENNGNSKIL